MAASGKYANREKRAGLGELRKQAAEADRLRKRLQALEAECARLRERCESSTRALQRECTVKDRAAEALELARVIIDHSPVVLFRRLAGDQPRLVYVSDNIRQFGYPAEEFLSGKVMFKDIVYPGDSERLSAEIRSYAERNVEEYSQQYRIVTRKGDVRWIEDQTSVVRDAAGNKRYHQGIVVDVTERKQAEEKLRKSEEKFRRIVQTAGEGFLLMDRQLAIVEVNDAYCRMLGYERAEILGKTPLDLATEDFRRLLTSQRDRILAQEYRKIEGMLRARDGRSVPVLIHGNTLRDAEGREIGNVAFVADLTEQKKALALAGKVQRNLIPRAAPRIRGLDIAGRSDSCDEVGGDYFDFLYGPEYPDDRLKVVVGDISGHGVDAALLMTSARAFIRSRAAQRGRPSQVVSRMNRDLVLDMAESGHFMTLFYMDIQPDTGRVQWVRAGHEPALVYDAAAERFEELVGTGLPLGVDASFRYSEQKLFDLPPGSVVVLGTDGVWEASDHRGRIFGKERFREAVREAARDSAADIIEHVFEKISAFSGGMPSQDDVTLVVIKFLPQV
jgi:sigma-B regulation protein RsbU (phosphoserine phosphatase)